MTTNERTSDDVSPPASTKPAAASDARPSDVPTSASSGVAPVSGRGTGTAKKKKKKKKANGASVTPPPASVAAAASPTAAPAPASTKSVPPPSLSTKSVPPASAANTNGSAAKSGREDEESVPPAADLDHHFFESHASGQAHDSLHPLSHADEAKAPDPRLAALMREETLRRRAQFTKYVKAIFAGSIVVCLAAVISVSVRRNHPDETVAAAAATTPMRPMRQAPPPPAPSSEDTAAPSATTASAPPAVDTTASVEPTPAATLDAPPSATAAATDTAPTPAPSASAAPSATVAAAEPSSDAPAELDPKAALKEKRQAQRNLDNGKIADAIEHGEASVKLDPTDAEAWLILGAAYQMKGDLANAKRSFGSCLKEGKRGPRGECAAMPH
jgi:Flp pilus assembly protein TadD